MYGPLGVIPAILCTRRRSSPLRAAGLPLAPRNPRGSCPFRTGRKSKCGSRTRVAPSRHARKAVLSYLFSGVEALERTPQPSPACAETEDAVQARTPGRQAPYGGPVEIKSRLRRPLGSFHSSVHVGGCAASSDRICTLPYADASQVLLTMAPTHILPHAASGCRGSSGIVGIDR